MIQAHEMLVGLHVTDDETYARYRAHMTPLLEARGGSFRYDFRIGEVLKSESAAALNRLFVISFPDAAAKDAFFADERYLAIKAEYFAPAVGAVELLAEYDRQEQAQ